MCVIYVDKSILKWFACVNRTVSLILPFASKFQVSLQREGSILNALKCPLPKQTTSFGKVGLVVVSGCKQSLRNCPWVVDFWTSYTRAMERAQTNHEEIIGK